MIIIQVASIDATQFLYHVEQHVYTYGQSQKETHTRPVFLNQWAVELLLVDHQTFLHFE